MLEGGKKGYSYTISTFSAQKNHSNNEIIDKASYIIILTVFYPLIFTYNPQSLNLGFLLGSKTLQA